MRRYGRATDAAGIRGVLRSSLARSVREIEDSSRVNKREPVNAFSHESLLAAARDMFADDRAQYRSLLDSWADSWQGQRWAPSVPRYLLTPYLRHLVIRSREPDTAGTARDRLSRLCSDPRWLYRAIYDTGVDDAIDALDGAQRALPAAWLDAITRSLRRSRVALAGDPDQLATQLYGRLAGEPDPNLQDYINRLPSIAPRQWVRLRSAALGWRADLETMFTYNAKVRAVAFGRVGSRVVLAVGAGDQIVVRDLQRGAGAEWLIDNDGLRVTTVAMGTIEGRSVVVAAAYDGPLAVRDIRTAELVGATMAGGPDIVAIGTLEGRPTVAGIDVDGIEPGRLLLWDVASGQPLERTLPTFAGRPIVGVGTVHGRLVAHLMELGDHDSSRLITINLDREGGEAAPPVALTRSPDLMASWADPTGIAIVTSDEAGHIADLATSSGPLRAVRSIDKDERVRAVAIARVADRYVATAAPDNDLEVGFVAISELTARTDVPAEPAESVRTMHVPQRDIEAVLIDDKNALQLLTADPVVLIDEWTGDVVDPHPDPELVATALTGQTRGDFIQQAKDGTVHFRNVLVTAHFRDVLATATDPGSRAGCPPQAPRRLVFPRLLELSLQADQPDSWPTLTRAFGVIGGNAVIARGSYKGTVWVQILASGVTVAGPFVDLPPASTISLNVKPSPDEVHVRGRRRVRRPRAPRRRVSASRLGRPTRRHGHRSDGDPGVVRYRRRPRPDRRPEHGGHRIEGRLHRHMARGHRTAGHRRHPRLRGRAGLGHSRAEAIAARTDDQALVIADIVCSEGQAPRLNELNPHRQVSHHTNGAIHIRHRQRADGLAVASYPLGLLSRPEGREADPKWRHCRLIRRRHGGHSSSRINPGTRGARHGPAR